MVFALAVLGIAVFGIFGALMDLVTPDREYEPPHIYDYESPRDLRVVDTDFRQAIADAQFDLATGQGRN